MTICGHTSVHCAVSAGNRVVGEEPAAQHGKRIDIHPLVLRESLAHAEHGEEVARHRAIQLCCGQRLRQTKHGLKHKVFKLSAGTSWVQIAHLTGPGSCEEPSQGGSTPLQDACVAQPVDKLFTQDGHVFWR